jgi:uncharacterized damage-inducible protein DinB
MRNENEILVRLFEHNLWANTDMLQACHGLSSEQLEREVKGTFGRLGHTLIHLARAQGGYLRQLTDWQPGPEHRLEYDDPFPGVDRIDEHLRFTGERLIDVARVATVDRILELESDGATERIAAWVVLLQAAHHATEHRQQIATTLTNLGLEPPEPDLWAFWDTAQSAPSPRG